jgi:hypothetical protein
MSLFVEKPRQVMCPHGPFGSCDIRGRPTFSPTHHWRPSFYNLFRGRKNVSHGQHVVEGVQARGCGDLFRTQVQAQQANAGSHRARVRKRSFISVFSDPRHQVGTCVKHKRHLSPAGPIAAVSGSPQSVHRRKCSCKRMSTEQRLQGT